MMTVEQQESVAWDEQRAELKTVLESEEFTRAPTLARLLSYLCERVFAGETDRIKEYSVGVDVFRRGTAFDQESDSIVRVEANRLRKRLAAYYARTGQFHRIQITIPVGQYVPKFEAASTSSQDSTDQRPVSRVSAGNVPQPLQLPPGQRRRVMWLMFAVGALLIASGSAWLVLRHKEPPSPVFQSNSSPPQQSLAQIGPPAGEEIRILAGSERSLADHAGKLWSSDEWFSGGIAVRSGASHVWRTLDPAFYRNSRQGQFRYDIPLKTGIYELRLHFAEMAFGPDVSGLGGEGSRLMTVHINGKTSMAGFDVIADSGASRTADVKVFPGIRPAGDGFLHLEFAGEDGKQAMLSAIEILPGIGQQIRPVRIVARQSPYYSNDSHWWSPDDYFEGGQLATYPEPVTGTDDPGLYETERWGNFSYAIPLAHGKYSLTLYFAARRGEAAGPSVVVNEGKPRVAHIFNVFCNGRTLLDNFNLSKEAYKADVVIRRFPGLEPNAQGKLLLSFIPVDGYATVAAVEVIPQ
jgi:hypothetical protein